MIQGERVRELRKWWPTLEARLRGEQGGRCPYCGEIGQGHEGRCPMLEVRGVLDVVEKVLESGRVVTDEVLPKLHRMEKANRVLMEAVQRVAERECLAQGECGRGSRFPCLVCGSRRRLLVAEDIMGREPHG